MTGLSDDDVRAVAEATARIVVELLRDEALLAQGLVDTSTAAGLLGVAPEYARDHAAELGGIRLGGKHSPLRFEVKRLREYIERQRLEPPASTRAARRPGPPRHTDGVELLALPEDA